MRIRVVCVRQYGAEEEAWALELDRFDLKVFLPLHTCLL